MSNPKIHVANDQAFQICPEWVLMAPISAQAIRLYLVLRKLGDNTTEESHWARTSIASAMQLKSPRSVDQYVQELVNIGALKVRPRFDGNRQTSNWYKVITADPSQYSTRVAESCTPGVAEEDTPGVAESCSQSQNLKELRTSKDSLQVSEQFDEFWAAYPRRKEKKRSQLAWKSAIKRATPEELIAAAKVYAADCKAQGREERFIKLASTWLNGDSWNDYTEATMPTTTISLSWADAL